MSAVETLSDALVKLRNEVRSLRQDVKKSLSANAETNTTIRAKSEDIPIEGPIPMNDLMVLDGSLEGKRVRVLKDDGCNTNVVSREFFRKNRGLFNYDKCDVEVKHSDKNSNEKASKVILGATLRIGKHKYKSNWLVANCRYDVLLGMPWHVANNPSIDYKERIVTVGSDDIFSENSPICAENKVQVMNLGVKKFRKMLKSSSYGAELQVFQLVQVNSVGSETGKSKEKLLNCSDPKLREVLRRFKNVLQEELPAGLPPKRSVDHEIETDKNSKPPHRPLFQLFTR